MRETFCVSCPAPPKSAACSAPCRNPDLDPGVRLMPLYGELEGAEQDAALAPSAPGARKIVLATSIAETSLTIEGVRVVVDSGMRRYSEFDPTTGMSRLVTGKVSQAAADQRRGRAGRLSAGDCYRLWSEGAHASLSPQTPPEILHADLAPLALELACWGATDADSLAWLDPPPAAPLAQARQLLQPARSRRCMRRASPPWPRPRKIRDASASRAYADQGAHSAPSASPASSPRS